MNTIELKDAPEVKRIVLAAFPNYRKHKAFVSDFRPTNINSYWDGGSKDEYALVHVPTMQRKGNQPKPRYASSAKSAKTWSATGSPTLTRFLRHTGSTCEVLPLK